MIQTILANWPAHRGALDYLDFVILADACGISCRELERHLSNNPEFISTGSSFAIAVPIEAGAPESNGPHLGPVAPEASPEPQPATGEGVGSA